MRALHAMHDVQLSLGETSNKRKTSNIGPQPSGQKEVQKKKEKWVGPPAGAGGVNKSNIYFKWSTQAQKNTTAKSRTNHSEPALVQRWFNHSHPQ